MIFIISFFIAHWYLSLFFQTFFLHRYAAHRTFTMSRFSEKVFFVLTWFFQGSHYLSAYGYGVMHRLHHAFADTEQDPHSPKYDDNLFKMMWKTKHVYDNINKRRIEVDPKYTQNVPQWKAFDEFASSWPSRLFWVGVYVAIYAVYATQWWLWLLLPIQILMAPVHGAIINWFAHIYGYRNFDVSDTSKNFLPVDFLMLGESYHNNHHKHGSRINFGGVRWHEIDPVYIIALGLEKIGVIKIRNKKAIESDSLKQAA